MIPVHPHMRGEYAAGTASIANIIGSPPHAWGIPQVFILFGLYVRFTPTCVGNTVSDPGDRVQVFIHHS